MSNLTVSELLRLDEILADESMPDLRFRRLYSAYAVKFGWPFDGLWGEDAAFAWRRWASLEVEYSL